MSFSRDLLQLNLSAREICAHTCPYVAACFIHQPVSLRSAPGLFGWESDDVPRKAAGESVVPVLFEIERLRVSVRFTQGSGGWLSKFLPGVLCKHVPWNIQMVRVLLWSAGAAGWASSRTLWVAAALLLLFIHLHSNLSLTVGL